MRTAELVRSSIPNLPIYARARNRDHAHRLLDLGVTNLQRETFLSSLDITKQLLKGLGISEREAGRMHPYLPHARRAPPDRGLQAGQRPRQAARARPQRRKDPGKALRGGCRRGSAPARGRAARGGFPVKPIICVGHAALDYVYRIEAFPPEPTKVRSLEHIESGGGMAANAAATIARLGGDGGAVEPHRRRQRRPAHSCVPRRPTASTRSYVRTLRAARARRPRRSSSTRRRAADHRRARPCHADGFELAAAGAHRRRRRGAQRLALGRGDARCVHARRGRAACRRCSTPISAAAALLAEFLCLADYAIFSAPALDEFAPGMDERAQLESVLALGVAPRRRHARRRRLYVAVEKRRSRPPAGFRGRDRRHDRRRRCLPRRLRLGAGRRPAGGGLRAHRRRGRRPQMPQAGRPRRPADARRTRRIPRRACGLRRNPRLLSRRKAWTRRGRLVKRA